MRGLFQAGGFGSCIYRIAKVLCKQLNEPSWETIVKSCWGTDKREVDFVVLQEGRPVFFTVECRSGEKNANPALSYFMERTPNWHRGCGLVVMVSTGRVSALTDDHRSHLRARIKPLRVPVQPRVCAYPIQSVRLLRPCLRLIQHE